MSVEIIKYGNAVNGANDGLEKAILELCIKITGEASTLAPVDQGTLRQSIMYKTDTAKSDAGSSPDISVQPKKLEGYVGSAIEYAVYQEYGTRYMRPQPFLRPAVAIWGKGKDALDIMKKKQQEQMKGNLNQSKSRVNFFK